MEPDRDVSCYVEDDTVQCTIDGQEPNQVIDEHRAVAKETFGDVASLESCAHLSEAFLRKRHNDEIPLTPQQHRQFAEAIITHGCPVHDFTHE